MADVTSPKEKMDQVVARDAAAPYVAPSLGSGGTPSRCPRCSFPLQESSRKDSAASGWTMAPFLRDSLATLGAGVGGSVSGFYAFNALMPWTSRRFPKSLALQYSVGVPPVALLASVGAGLGAGILPAFVQVCMSSYYHASSTSNGAILETHRSLTNQQKPSHGKEQR